MHKQTDADSPLTKNNTVLFCLDVGLLYYFELASMTLLSIVFFFISLFPLYMITVYKNRYSYGYFELIFFSAASIFFYKLTRISLRIILDIFSGRKIIIYDSYIVDTTDNIQIHASQIKSISVIYSAYGSLHALGFNGYVHKTTPYRVGTLFETKEKFDFRISVSGYGGYNADYEIIPALITFSKKNNLALFKLTRSGEQVLNRP